MRLRAGRLTVLPKIGSAISVRVSSATAGLASGARPSRPRRSRQRRRDRRARSRRCRRAGRPRRRPRHSGARRCRVRPSASAISCWIRRCRSSRRNSSTRRRWRSSVIVSPTTLPAASEGQVGDLGPDVRDGARLLGLDLGGGADPQAFELLAGRGDIGVARLLGDLLGAGQDVVRLAAGLAQRGDALGLGVLTIAACLSASFRPCSIRSLRSASIADTGLNANAQMMHEEQDEVERADDHPEQVDLEQRVAAPRRRAATTWWPPPRRRGPG